MGDISRKAEDMKGRAKEAAGDITDDEGLKAEGKLDRLTANIKDKVDDVKDRVSDAVNRK